MAAWLEASRSSSSENKGLSRTFNSLAHLYQRSFPAVVKARMHRIRRPAGRDCLVPSRRSENLNRVFGRLHPDLTLGYLPGLKFGRFRFPAPLFGLAQRHYFLIQDYVPIRWEWRLIKIGNSYFGHQKLLKGQYASGSGAVGWVRPPDALLDMVRENSDESGFHSLARWTCLKRRKGRT